MSPIPLSRIDTSLIRLLHHTYHGYRETDGVFLIDIGFKHESDPSSTDELCVRVHRHHIDSEYVETRGKVELHYYREDTHPSRPATHDKYTPGVIQPGISVRAANRRGTLGAICYQGGNPSAIRALTCLHVVKNDKAYIPDTEMYYSGNAVGPLRNFSKHHDVALFEPRYYKPENIKTEIYGQNISLSGTAEPRLGAVLSKVGATTDFTRAIIDGIGGIYLPRSRPEITHCFRLIPLKTAKQTEISLPGDSGAIWYNQQGLGVGLHLDGEKTNTKEKEFAIAQSLDPILDLFQLTITATPVV